jgi:glutamyl-tRNA synthetase/glutamyl-Q tRNA(Asp) synthetase
VATYADSSSGRLRVHERPITRFAPSPTGYLHLGHVVNALFVWGIAQRAGGTVLLRIEDHDRIRSRPEFEAALLDDLSWLGFAPVGGDGGTPATIRQRDRADIYEAALHALRRRHPVYACDCSRRHIGGEQYPGRCRERGLADAPGTGLRVRIEPGDESFEDLRLGPITQTPAEQCGDLLIRDRDGQWTYQYAVTVDDLLQGVDLVIRGADLVESTGRQMRLTRMLSEAGVGTARPVTYLHHPLVLDADGRKLSKSRGAAGVRSMRQRGLSPGEVIGQAAAAIGLVPPGTRLEAGSAGDLFPWASGGGPFEASALKIGQT